MFCSKNTPQNLMVPYIVDQAARVGLPSRFLNVVKEHYCFKLGNRDYAQYNFSYISLTQGVYDDLRNVSLARSGVGTFYHESTHAFMDIKRSVDPRYKEIFKKGIAYYKDAPLINGAKANDPEYLFGEAVASYVGVRVHGWATALDSLNFVFTKLTSSDFVYQKSSVIEHLEGIKKSYNDTMAMRKYGYQYVDGFLGFGSKQADTSRPLPDWLAKFLDREILEGRIPNNFMDVPVFRDIEASIRLAANELQ